ncbi:MAG: FAD-binding protein [Candidatus Calescibacterium sp.]|nr:FAD-binding protein [Candidatus Calescibacterium sp.]MCX7734812.1 FAD-binding protein [bacterium]MDW8087423.1 FAD-binding protein [Candidatus Calescibacterium sp.]
MNQYDLVVVGSGAGGLVGALVGSRNKMKVLVLEKTEKIGGSSSMSGGGMWIPTNPYINDSYDNAIEYLNNVVPKHRTYSPKKIENFIKFGPKMLEFLTSEGIKIRPMIGYPDYYPEKPGGKKEGRAVEPDIFNGKKLGKYLKILRRYPGMPPIAMFSREAADFILAKRSLKGFSTALKVIFRTIFYFVTFRYPLTMGGSLVGQILHRCLQNGVEIWINSKVIDFEFSNNRVISVVVEKDGKEIKVPVKSGVVLASGGFERSQDLREKFLPKPTDYRWTVGASGNEGDIIKILMKYEADTDLLDKAWGGPVAITPDQETVFLVYERSLPFCIIVDSQGRRFMNESAPYTDCWERQYKHNIEVPCIPAWLIMDKKHRSSYPFGKIPPGITPNFPAEKGFLVKADSLEKLAETIKIKPESLVETVKRFNDMAKKGKDTDFHRGESAYDRYYGDPRVKPNPNLGPIDKPPFYATAIYPGDLGTLGGLVTDENGRIMKKDGTKFENLYATGNVSCSPFGGTYPGPGSTLGPACTFAYISVLNIIKSSEEQK